LPEKAHGYCVVYFLFSSFLLLSICLRLARLSDDSYPDRAKSDGLNQRAPMVHGEGAGHTAHMFNEVIRCTTAMKVYVVEDSAAICQRIVQMVQEIEDMDVVGTADDVLGAIQGIEASMPDVVILDIRLFNGNGLNVLQHVKKTMPTLKVIVLTNFNSDQYRKLANRYGADAFLDKSNDFAQIPNLLRTWQPKPGHAVV
jgi:CheY-like chemotaxis protein